MESRTRCGLHFLPVRRYAVVLKRRYTLCSVSGAPLCLQHQVACTGSFWCSIEGQGGWAGVGEPGQRTRPQLAGVARPASAPGHSLREEIVVLGLQRRPPLVNECLQLCKGWCSGGTESRWQREQCPAAASTVLRTATRFNCHRPSPTPSPARMSCTWHSEHSMGAVHSAAAHPGRCAAQ